VLRFNTKPVTNARTHTHTLLFPPLADLSEPRNATQPSSGPATSEAAGNKHAEARPEAPVRGSLCVWTHGPGV
jgi:hypothetical protein